MPASIRLPVLFAIAALTLFAVPARSEMQKAEPAILTVTDHNGTVALALTRSELEAFPQQTVVTTTTWTDGVQTFAGPLMRDVLEASHLSGDTVRAVALNDYAVEIPRADFSHYRVILALRQNGQPMPVRDKGPIWIVYPRDDHAELVSADQNAKWIWQLSRLELH